MITLSIQSRGRKWALPDPFPALAHPSRTDQTMPSWRFICTEATQTCKNLSSLCRNLVSGGERALLGDLGSLRREDCVNVLAMNKSMFVDVCSLALMYTGFYLFRGLEKDPNSPISLLISFLSKLNSIGYLAPSIRTRLPLAPLEEIRDPLRETFSNPAPACPNGSNRTNTGKDTPWKKSARQAQYLRG